MPTDSPILDATTAARIAAARTAALSLLNMPASPPKSYHEKARHIGRDNVTHENEGSKAGNDSEGIKAGNDNEGEEYGEEEEYTPPVGGGGAGSNNNSGAYMYPTYAAYVHSSTTPFKPASYTVKVPGMEALGSSPGGTLLRSFGRSQEGSPVRVKRERGGKEKESSEVVFTTKEVAKLERRIRTGDVTSIKRLVCPDLTKVTAALVALLGRVIGRGAVVGDADKALRRSFEVFAGRRETVVGGEEFGRKLNGISMTWSSFTRDECAGVAHLVGAREVVTIDDFLTFAYERCGNAANSKSRGQSRGERDESESVDGFYEEGGRCTVAKEFLEEKWQIVCAKARRMRRVDVWGLVDEIESGEKSMVEGIEILGGVVQGGEGTARAANAARSNVVKSSKKGAKATSLAPEAQSPGSNEGHADEYSDEVMKKIALDCTKLKRELAAKEAQILKLKRQAGGGEDGGGGAERRKSPAVAAPRGTVNGANSADGAGGVTRGEEIKKTSVMVMFANMGMPAEDECFDEPPPPPPSGGNEGGAGNESYLYDGGDTSMVDARQLSFSNVETNKERSTTSFDKLIGYDRKGGTVISMRGGRGTVGVRGTAQSEKYQQQLRRIHLGYKHTPGGRKGKAVNMGIFKTSRCSSSSNRHKPGEKNKFNKATHAWEREGEGHKTDATRLFKDRFSDNNSSALAKEMFRGFG